MKSKKRIFIGLISLSLTLTSGLLFFSWHLIFRSPEPYQLRILAIIAGLFFIFLIILGIGIAGLIVFLWRERNMPPILQNIMLFAVNVLFPAALFLGKIFKIDQQTIKSSFVEVNNQLVISKQLSIEPQKIMILAPHCLQKIDCPYKITIDVNNCRRCGQCPINDLHEVAQKYGVRFVVATGGSIARKIIQKDHPKAVVAIACERDLTSGIKDSRLLPILGVFNIRPEGPCYNTRVNLITVEKAVKFFLSR